MSDKITFKQTIVLAEARREDLKYSEKVVKNKVDRVTVELEGNDSGIMTKLAARWARLDKAIRTMSTKRDEVHEKLKSGVTDLFNAEDVVLTRVVETASFVMTLSKLVKSSDQDSKVVVNYQAIAEDLAKLIPEELQPQVDAIVKLYTEVKIAAEKAPALRVKEKVDEAWIVMCRHGFSEKPLKEDGTVKKFNTEAEAQAEAKKWRDSSKAINPVHYYALEESLITEGVVDLIKKIGTLIAKAARKAASWAVSYDKKLANLKKQLGGKVTEEQVVEAKKPSFDPESFLAKKYWVNPKELSKIHREVRGNPDVEELNMYVEWLFKELHKRGKLKLPLTFSGGSYAYTITKTNPLTVVASDGSEVDKIKYFSDIGNYSEQFWLYVFDQTPESAQEKFSNKKKTQAEHEAD